MGGRHLGGPQPSRIEDQAEVCSSADVEIVAELKRLTQRAQDLLGAQVNRICRSAPAALADDFLDHRAHGPQGCSALGRLARALAL